MNALAVESSPPTAPDLVLADPHTFATIASAKHELAMLEQILLSASTMLSTLTRLGESLNTLSVSVTAGIGPAPPSSSAVPQWDEIQNTIPTETRVPPSSHGSNTSNNQVLMPAWRPASPRSSPADIQRAPPLRAEYILGHPAAGTESPQATSSPVLTHENLASFAAALNIANRVEPGPPDPEPEPPSDGFLQGARSYGPTRETSASPVPGTSPVPDAADHGQEEQVIQSVPEVTWTTISTNAPTYRTMSVASPLTASPAAVLTSNVPDQVTAPTPLADDGSQFERPPVPTWGTGCPEDTPELRQGTILIDGAELGRWIIDHIADNAMRPCAGTTGIDPRITATFPGAPTGG